MRYVQFFRFSLLLISVLFSLNSFAQDSSSLQLNLLNLPEGAKARFGKGKDGFGAVAYSPDGRLAVANNIGIWFYDTATYQEVALLTGYGYGYEVLSLAFSPDGSTIASGSNDRTIRLWDAHTGELLRVLAGYSVVFSPDGSTIASGSDDNTIRLWDAHTGELLGVLAGHSVVAFSPDGRTLTFMSEGGLWLWDIDMEEHVLTLEGAPPVAYSPDGRILASGSRDDGRNIILWDTHSGRYLRLHTLEGHTQPVTSVAFSPDGSTIASAGGGRFWKQEVDNTIRLWDTDTGEHLRTLTGHTAPVTSVAFSPDGSTIAGGVSSYGGNPSNIHLWDADTGKQLPMLPITMIGNNTLIASPNGHTLASVGDGDTTTRLWNVDTLELLRTFEGVIVAFSPDGNTIATGDEKAYDATIMRLWDVNTGELLSTFTFEGSFPESTGSVNTVAFSHDRYTIAIASSYFGGISLWDVDTGQHLRTIEARGGSVYSVAFSPDGRTIASGGQDATIYLWNLNTKKILNTLKGHTDYINSVAFSPDGSTIASGSRDVTIRLWDTDTGELRRTLEGHTGSVNSVAFSPDGSTIASGSSLYRDAPRPTIRLWDADTGEQLRTLTGHTAAITSVAFSLDGTLASRSLDGTMLLWENPLCPTGLLIRENSGVGLRGIRVRSIALRSVPMAALSLVGVGGGHGSINLDDATIRLWDADTGELRHALVGHWITGEYSAAVSSVAFNPDGSTIASGGFNTIHLWDAHTGEQLRTA